MAKTESTQTDTTKQKAALRQKAQTIVLDRHRDEFNQVAESLFKKAGLEFSRRLTEEEKAERELEKLLERNPHLRDKLALTGVDVPPAAQAEAAEEKAEAAQDSVVDVSDSDSGHDEYDYEHDASANQGHNPFG